MDKKPTKILLAEAQMRGFARNKDGTVNYTFRSLNAIPNEDFALTDQYYQRTGWLAFKLDEVTLKDIPAENATVKGSVSPSKYLRTRLFAKHMAMGGSKEDFPDYYERAMYGFAEAVDDSYEV